MPGSLAVPCLGNIFTNPVCNSLGSITGGIGSSITSSVFDAMSSWASSGAAWLIGRLAASLSTTLNFSLGDPWFESVFKRLAALAPPIALAMFPLLAIRAVILRRGEELLRALTVTLPIAVLGTLAASQVIQMALDWTDLAAGALVGGRQGPVVKGLTSVVSSLASGGPLAPPSFVNFLIALVCVVGALLLWIELLIRNAAVATAVLFVPLVLSAAIWPALAHWPRRLAETLAALVLSKLVIAGILALAFSAVQQGKGPASALLGGALLLLAAFSPFTLLRLLPLAEAGAAGALEGARRQITAPAVLASRMAMSSVSSAWAGGTSMDQAMSNIGVEAIQGLGLPQHPGGGPLPDFGASPPSDDAGQTSPVATMASAERGDSSPSSGGASSGSVAFPGRYEIGHDQLGPVIRWIDESPAEPPSNA
ncbi:MAG: hypothetical protein WCO31_01265 [Actinomycetes bacterium]